MTGDRILLVEDDAELGAHVVSHLRRAGYDSTWIRDGDLAEREDPSRYSLLILDLMLPGTYGMDLLKRFRSYGSVPVIILSARDDSADKVRALTLGADDYVTKPFWPEELTARVAARLRRPLLERKDGPLRIGPLVIDVSRSAVSVDDVPIDLTRAELRVLLALARRAGAPVSRQTLVDAALDSDVGGTERTLDVHVSRLRRKIAPHGDMIATVWRIGYKIVEP